MFVALIYDEVTVCFSMGHFLLPAREKDKVVCLFTFDIICRADNLFEEIPVDSGLINVRSDGVAIDYAKLYHIHVD